jgi:hypothetical protein
MRGLAMGIALAAILFLVEGGHFLLVPLLIPIGFFALLRNRATWQPVSRRIAPEPGDQIRLNPNEALPADREQRRSGDRG